MNLCIFNSFFSDFNIEGWKYFINFFDKNHNIYILTESLQSKQKIYSQCNNIKVISINEEISKSNFDLKNSHKYEEKYFNTTLFQERMSIINSPHSLFIKDKNNFEEILISHLDFFEKFLRNNNIDKILMCIVESYQSYIYSVLEKVCIVNNYQILTYQYPILRCFVYENQIRYSKIIFDQYESLKINKLQNTEINKTKLALQAYKQHLNSESHYNYVYLKKRIYKELLKIKVYNFIKKLIYKKKINTLNFVSVDFCSNNNINYSILLLNKTYNYRNHKFTPFYSLPENLIRNISLSLPFNHYLLVKIHPHDLSINNAIIDEVNNNYNVKVINPLAKLSEVIPNSKLVFSMSTTAAIESLVYFKKLIMFGENLQFFGKDFDIVTRITNFENIKYTVKELLHTKINETNIINFFYCFFKNSYSRDSYDDNKWDRFKILSISVKDLYIKAATTLNDQLMK